MENKVNILMGNLGEQEDEYIVEVPQEVPAEVEQPQEEVEK